MLILKSCSPPCVLVAATEDSTPAARTARASLSPYQQTQLASPQQPPAYGPGPSQVMQSEPALQYEDVWVTVYGFTQVRARVRVCVCVCVCEVVSVRKCVCV